MTVDGVALNVEASIGIALVPDHAKAADELLQRADVALDARAYAADAWRCIRRARPLRRGAAGAAGRGPPRPRTGRVHALLPTPDRAAHGARDGGGGAAALAPPATGHDPAAAVHLADRADRAGGPADAARDRPRPAPVHALAAGGAAVGNVGEPLRAQPPRPRAARADRLSAGTPRGPGGGTHGRGDPERGDGRPRTAVGVLEALRALGVGVSIDDFGSGNASIAYLAKLPVGQLKIDRSFVTPMCRAPERRRSCAPRSTLPATLGCTS